MAVEPLSLMYATAGVSSRALQLARHDMAPSGPTYQQRLSAVHTMMNKAPATASSQPCISTQQTMTLPSAAATQGGSMALQLNLGKSLPGPSSLAQSAAGRSSGSRARAACSSNQLGASKLLQPEFYTLASIDFAATADSSVGGGGLPRPYGRFTAARNGDGNAVWERLPPTSSTVWPSKRSLSAVAMPQSASDAEQTAEEAAGSHPASQRAQSTSRSRYSVSGLKPGKLAQLSNSSMAVPRTGDLSAAPVPGPVALKVGVTLPSATFLTDVPSLPGNVRVDCGYSRTKDFLLAGLPRAAAQATAEATSGSSWALTMQEPEAAAPPPPPQEPSVAPEASPSQGQRDSQDVAGHRRSLHAAASARVEDQITETLMRGSSTEPAQDPATGSPVIASHYILSAISDAHHAQPATVSVAPDLATGRRVKQLPQEHALPRRHVPGVGK